MYYWTEINKFVYVTNILLELWPVTLMLFPGGKESPYFQIINHQYRSQFLFNFCGIYVAYIMTSVKICNIWKFFAIVAITRLYVTYYFCPHSETHPQNGSKFINFMYEIAPRVHLSVIKHLNYANFVPVTIIIKIYHKSFYRSLLIGQTIKLKFI